MVSTREKLIDWLADLPDNTEIGIEDIYLVAMVGRAQSFTVGDLSDESIDIDLASSAKTFTQHTRVAVQYSNEWRATGERREVTNRR